MATIRHREMINPELLDESGLRKEPYEHEKLKKDERKVVVRFTDQSYLKVVLITGEVVHLRELRENLYRWFPELKAPRPGITIRKEREPVLVHRKRVLPDLTFKEKLKKLVEFFISVEGNLIDTRIAGRISNESISKDFLRMEILADIAIHLEKITIPESSEIFNEWFPKVETHRNGYLWLRTAFLTRAHPGEYLLTSIKRALIPAPRLDFDDESRRLQLNVYMGYRKYKLKKVTLMDSREKFEDRVIELTEITQGRMFGEQIKSIKGYSDRILVRMQYLLIGKVLKPLQKK